MLGYINKKDAAVREWKNLVEEQEKLLDTKKELILLLKAEVELWKIRFTELEERSKILSTGEPVAQNVVLDVSTLFEEKEDVTGYLGRKDQGKDKEAVQG